MIEIRAFRSGKYWRGALREERGPQGLARRAEPGAPSQGRVRGGLEGERELVFRHGEKGGKEGAMDDAGRLTKWAEWEVGEMYQWRKSRQVGAPQRCVEVNRKEGYVRFDRGDEHVYRCYAWRGRFIRVPDCQ